MAKNKRTKSDRRKTIWKKANGLCAHCGKATGATQQTIDHVIPKSFGGGDDQRNLMPLCKDCNQRRMTGKIEPLEYYAYASEWAKEEMLDYFTEWKMDRRDSNGDIILMHPEQWIF